MVRFPFVKTTPISVDIGSAVTKLMVLDQVQWQGPSCLALDDAGNAVNLGELAESLLGKEPRGISVRIPFKRGAVVNEQWGEQYLQMLTKKHLPQAQTKLHQLGWSIHLPYQLSIAEKTAFSGLCRSALGRVQFVSSRSAVESLMVEELLPAHGSVLQLGADSSWLMVCANQKVVAEFDWQWGGMSSLLELIQSHLMSTLEIQISRVSARQLLEQVASVGNQVRPESSLVLQAKSSRTQASVSQIITTRHVQPIVESALNDLLWWLQGSLAEMAETHHKQLLTHGVWLMGGGAKLPGLSSLISERLGCPVQVISNPELAMVRGMALRGL